MQPNQNNSSFISNKQEKSFDENNKSSKKNPVDISLIEQNKLKQQQAQYSKDSINQSQMSIDFHSDSESRMQNSKPIGQFQNIKQFNQQQASTQIELIREDQHNNSQVAQNSVIEDNHGIYKLLNDHTLLNYSNSFSQQQKPNIKNGQSLSISKLSKKQQASQLQSHNKPSSISQSNQSQNSKNQQSSQFQNSNLQQGQVQLNLQFGHSGVQGQKVDQQKPQQLFDQKILYQLSQWQKWEFVPFDEGTSFIDKNSAFYQKVKQLIDRLTLQYPDQIKFLKQTFENDQLQMIKKFRLFYPIKPSKSSIDKKLPKQQKKLRKPNPQYHLEECKQGEYSKYIVLNLSFQQFNLTQMVKCKWKNIIDLNLKWCNIDNEGWQKIVDKIKEFPQLRKFDASSNQISIIKHEHLFSFLSLKHLFQLNLLHNPFNGQSFAVLLETQKFIKPKINLMTIQDKDNMKPQFIFNYSRIEFNFEQFKWQNYLKLQKEDLKQVRKIQWKNKKFDNQQWKLFVDQFKIFQSLRSIDFSQNLVVDIALKDLTSLNFMLEKDTKIQRNLQIYLENNPVQWESYKQISRFYQKWKWSKLCIIYKEFSKQFHQRRLTNYKIKQRIFQLLLMVLKNRPLQIINIRLQDLIQLVEQFIEINQDSELKVKGYVENIFEYVQEQLKRVHGQKKYFNRQNEINQRKQKFFQQYEKVLMNINQDIMLQLQ